MRSNKLKHLRRMLKDNRMLLLGASIAVTISLLSACRDQNAISDGTTWDNDHLPHQAYVWQRQWTDSLKDSIRKHGQEFDRLVALGAEISFRENRPEVIYTEADYKLLQDLECEVGIALRIGSFSGPFRPDDETTRLIAETASRLLKKAKESSLEPVELQIDFDCATSKLPGYRTWMEALRPVVKAPLTFTALPTWLDSREFPALAKASDGFVLQVHSLERPSGPDETIHLCGSALALAAVEKASRIGVPFRVALPTYGYVVAFDAQGKFAGISAGSLAGVSPKGRIREVRSDPVAIAGLVAAWQKEKPVPMDGIIWYRFPSEDDRLNWRWTTLNAIMQGRVPYGQLIAAVESPKMRLWEVHLLNQGDADASLDVCVVANWGAGSLVASDSLQGFMVGNVTTNRIELRLAQNALPTVLAPGEKRMIGWMRLTEDTEVKVYVSPTD